MPCSCSAVPIAVGPWSLAHWGRLPASLTVAGGPVMPAKQRPTRVPLDLAPVGLLGSGGPGEGGLLPGASYAEESCALVVLPWLSLPWLVV